jgi:hypothetical protein
MSSGRRGNAADLLDLHAGERLRELRRLPDDGLVVVLGIEGCAPSCPLLVGFWSDRRRDDPSLGAEGETLARPLHAVVRDLELDLHVRVNEFERPGQIIGLSPL